MDPLFERRQLSKKVHIYSKFLQKNMQASILAQLKMNFEGKCSAEGFVQRNSITIVNYSLGRTNYIKGGVDYDVQFQADVCMPHTGQRFKAPVTVRSKVGIHAETPPIKVLIPRDLHIGNEDFENAKIGEDIEFEVVGCQFKQQDRDIIVVAKLLSRVAAPVEQPLLSANPIGDLLAAVLPVDSDIKQVVTTPIEPEKPKKRKLKQSAGNLENEQVLSFKIGDA
uniref:S1 motif domain-containing protein n=1 Tax=viral metagenome TaxID=1070528 RepID=A0A6C0ER47_9ZZZZ